MLQRKPIIGLTGGIGSGKSFIAKLFGELGCRVIESDVLVHQALAEAGVRQTLRQVWGDAIFAADGSVDRKALAKRVFESPVERNRLESMLHPRVAAVRQRLMAAAANDAQVLAFVWDTPLLFETGLSAECDQTVFVEAPEALRIERVRASRGWTEQDLRTREIAQWPLEKKRSLSHYVIRNTADAEVSRGQVREVLSRILETSRLGRFRASGPVVGHSPDV